jgi:hypothetical protein
LRRWEALHNGRNARLRRLSGGCRLPALKIGCLKDPAQRGANKQAVSAGGKPRPVNSTAGWRWKVTVVGKSSDLPPLGHVLRL